MWPASALTPESTFLMFLRACHRFFDLILDYGISNVTHSRVSLGEIEIEIEIEGTARITYDLSPPSFDRNGITLKKRKKKKRKNAYVIGTYVIETITIQYVRRWMRNMRLTSRCPCQNVFDISLKVYK